MVNYPIISPYREILIPLEMAIVFIFLEIGIYFFYKYLNNKRTKIPSMVELDWGIIFTAFGAAFIFYIIGDNFVSNRDFFLILGYLSLNIGGVLFFFHIELSKAGKHRFIYTPIFLGVLFTFIITYFISPAITQFVANSVSLIAYIILISYFLMIVKRIWAFYKIYSLGLLVGILFWFVGYAGNTDMAITLFGGFYIRIIGDIVILSGMILVGFFLNAIPSLAEIGWQKKMKYIILTNKGGLGLFIENFQNDRIADELLVAGALSGINIFMNTVMKKNGSTKVISKGNDKFLIYEGKKVIGILVVEQELEIFKYLLKKFIEQFEDFYAQILDNWVGNIEIFRPARQLAAEIFAQQKL